METVQSLWGPRGVSSSLGVGGLSIAGIMVYKEVRIYRNDSVGSVCGFPSCWYRDPRRWLVCVSASLSGFGGFSLGPLLNFVTEWGSNRLRRPAGPCRLRSPWSTGAGSIYVRCCLLC